MKKLRAQLEELKKKENGKGETENPPGDPMEGVEEGDLANKAGTAAKAASTKQARADRASTKPMKLADARILKVGSTGDEHIDQVADFTNTKLSELMDKLPEAQREELAPAVDQFAASAYQLAMGLDLAKRGFAIANKASGEAVKVMNKPKSCRDSPSKIAGLVNHLRKPGFNIDTVKQSLDGMFNLAGNKITEGCAANERISPDKLLLDLTELLSQHQQAKKTRATKQDFANHVSRAMSKVKLSIAAAKDRGDADMAFKLLQSMQELEAGVTGFFSVTDKLGFESTREIYLSKGSGFAALGITDENWASMVAMASNKEYADNLLKLLDGKLPKVAPQGNKGSKGKRAATDSDSDSETSDSASKPPARKRKNISSRHNHGAPVADNRPYCVGCGRQGHLLVDCRTVKAMLGNLRAGGVEGNNNGGKKPDRRPANA
jgi:hypothetical protein